MSKTFRKRAGTTNLGGDYEILNVANISMQLVMDDSIHDFRISSNDEAFGAFDDVVVETEMKNGTEIIYSNYAVQLKHKDRGNLSLTQLTQAKGDFSFKKYFHSVQTLQIPETNFILFTNLKFNVAEDTKFYLDGENFPIIATKIEANFPFKISHKSDCCYKFSVVKDGSYENSDTVSSYEKFFEIFFLYVDQENIHNLERNVTEKFKKLFCGNDTECDQFVKYLNKWGLEDGKKEKLDKKWIKLVIALNIFSSRIKPLSFNHNKVIEDTKIVKRNILRETIAAFDVTIFKKQSYNEVKILWDDAKSELKDLKVVNKLRKKYQLLPTHVSDIDQVDSLTLSKLLWLLGKCPLILKQDESVEKAVDLCGGEKFILLKNDSVYSCKNDVCVFETLWNLKTRTFLYDRLVQNFTCSIEGKEEIRLEQLIKVDENILSVLKTDDLLGQCSFGETYEKLSEPYIERCVLKNAIDFKILNNITDETLIILDSLPQNIDLKARLKSHTLININVEKGKTQILNLEDSNDKKSRTGLSGLNTTIYFSEKRCNYDEFNAIFNKIRNAKNLHQFRVRDDGNLEWVRTKGDVSDLEKYRLSQYYYVRERDLDSSEFENNINLLIGDPGMGKSELMKSLKVKCFPEYFTISVDPKDVYSFLTNTHYGDNCVNVFKKFILEKKYKSLSERDQAIFSYLLKKNQIIYVWDALDELSDKHRDIVTDIIVELSKNCVQWVTSRYHLKHMLQKKFNVLSLNLNKFNDDEQTNYIQERLSVDETTNEGIHVIIDKIKSSFALVEHKDILGIPLQLFMLTELFLQDRKKYSALLDNFFRLSDLYHYFIEEKINILYKDKLGIDLTTSFTESLIQNQKVKIFEEYTNAALRLLFPDTTSRQLAVQNKDILQTIHNTHNNIGLVTEMKDQLPRFLHNSFAEYLAARYFVSNLEHSVIQTEDLFDAKYTNVRFFFDLLMSGGSQTHIAVLYKNYRFLNSYNSDLTNKDRGGRSALHLACSWGQRYPELNVKYVGGNYIVDDDGKFGTIPDTREYLETIDFLLEKCDICEPDEIYKMTPAEYARKARCGGIEMRTTMKEITLKLKSTKRDFIIKGLYYSAHYGYYYEFAFFYDELSIKVEQNLVKQKNDTRRKLLSSAIATNIKNNAGMTLLYIAAKMGNVQIVELLSKNGADIDAANKNGVTPLYVASQNGHDKIVQLLSKAGVDIDAADEDGETPLYVAAYNGHDKIVELLSKAGADIDAAEETGATPLNVASQNGHDKIVELLSKNGADINAATKDGVTPLLIAAYNGHDEIVELLSKNGADIDAADKEGETPLYVAAQYGHDKIVELLSKAGADIDAANKDGETPLYVAAYNGHDQIVELLSKAGADINAAMKDGTTPISVAAQNGHDQIVELLSKAGADINAADNDGYTPIYVAAQNGHDKIVELLSKAGADINAANKDGVTPIYVAAENGHDQIVELLSKAGADINAAMKDGTTPISVAAQNGHDQIVELLSKAGADINAAMKDGTTPISVAAQNGHDQIVELLSKAGADINAAMKDGTTPISVAAQNGHDQIVELLSKAGADINAADNDGYTPIYVAAQNGHDKIVELLSKAGADINAANKDGVTPIYVAAENGHDQIVELLSKAGADINAAMKDGTTPISVAAQNGHDQIVELLSKAGADINAADNDGYTPIYVAAQNGHDKIVELLSKAGADINAANKDGVTPIYVAAQNGHDKIVELLSKAGADINAADKDGVTPIYVAAENGHDQIVELLSKAGADINAAMKDGTTPISVAAQNGHDQIVELLSKAGADINAADNDGYTPIYVAAQNGHDKIVELLSKAGADINAANKDGVTPIYVAAQNGHDKIVELLSKAGADINAADKDGVTPIYVAAENGHDKIVELLSKAGADINAAMKDGATPIYVAAQNGHDKIVELLSKAGADINAADKDGVTPIYVAAENGHDQMVELLSKAGADINAAMKDGTTPISVAAQNGHDQIVELLSKAGADINAADNDGYTPIYVAAQNGHDKIVELLSKAGADINAADKDGVTPIYVAAQNGHDKIVELLSKAGADINAADKDGVTPIYVAAENGHDKIVELLSKAGADISVADKDGVTPIYVAAQNGHDKIVELLSKAGADINAAMKDGYTPIYVAAHNGHDKIVELLSKAGADINAADKDGVTPIYVAAENGHDQIVELLSKAGADINAAMKDGATPIYVAAQNGHDKIVELLSKGGADINAARKDGNTPLYIASQKGHDKIVELLSKDGADVNAADKDDMTPLYVAAKNGHDKIVEFLIRVGADVNLPTKYGWTPLYIASKENRTSIVTFLKQSGAI